MVGVGVTAPGRTLAKGSAAVRCYRVSWALRALSTDDPRSRSARHSGLSEVPRRARPGGAAGGGLPESRRALSRALPRRGAGRRGGAPLPRVASSSTRSSPTFPSCSWTKRCRPRRSPARAPVRRLAVRRCVEVGFQAPRRLAPSNPATRERLRFGLYAAHLLTLFGLALSNVALALALLAFPALRDRADPGFRRARPLLVAVARLRRAPAWSRWPLLAGSGDELRRAARALHPHRPAARHRLDRRRAPSALAVRCRDSRRDAGGARRAGAVLARLRRSRPPDPRTVLARHDLLGHPAAGRPAAHRAADVPTAGRRGHRRRARADCLAGPGSPGRRWR